MENKKVIGAVQILQHLKDGMTRDDIAEHYGITKAECKILFKDDRLKGKKTIKKPTFVLVDDATAGIEVEEETVDATETITDTQEAPTEEVEEQDNATDTTDSVEEDVVEEEEQDAEAETARATWGD